MPVRTRLGHHVDRTSRVCPEVEESYVDKRSDDTRGEPAEVYANEFAGSLLMPDEELRLCVESWYG